MESPPIFHHGVNPRRQETAGEESQCSQTPAHPGKRMTTITMLSDTSRNHSVSSSKHKLTSTSSFKLHTCIQRSPLFMYSLQIFSLQPLFMTTTSMPWRNFKLSLVLGGVANTLARIFPNCCAIKRADPASYLQTRTSSGWRVLGVMIQGATLNTTVSVKMGVSGIPCGNATHASGLQTNALRRLSFPFTWARSSSSWCLCCATPTQFSLPLYLSPSAFIMSMGFD